MTNIKMDKHKLHDKYHKKQLNNCLSGLHINIIF